MNVSSFSSEGTPEISQPQSDWWLARNNVQVPQGRRTFSIVLSGRNFLRPVFQPLRGWLISDGRSATQFVLAAVLFFAVDAMAQTTNALSDAEIQGHQLAQQLCDLRPAESFTNTGVLEIRDGKGNRTNYPAKCTVIVEATNWDCIYEAIQRSKTDQPIWVYILSVTHSERKPNNYITFVDHGLGASIPNSETMLPFCHSDFWLADLGLEFFHWPQQKVLKKEVHRSCGCTVLESTNPNPTTNGYSRVVSWIDNDSLGIVEAYAYDANGKKLKNFYPKNLEKVNGQYQVQSMVMENLQTGSKTHLEFDLKK